MKSSRDLLSLPVSEIIRPASEYDAAYRARLNRLKEQRPTRDGSLQKKFDACIELTERSRQTALQLADARLKATEYQTKGLDFLLSLVGNSLSALNSKVPDQRTRAGISAIHNEAMQLYRKMVMDADKPENRDKSANDWFKDNIEPHDELTADIHTASVKSDFVVIHHSVDQKRSAISTAALISELAVLLEGILYSAVFGVAGGSLDKKIRSEAILATLRAVISLVPFAGPVLNVLDFVDTWKKWKELDSIPDIVKQADRLNEYLQTYEHLCALWLTYANNVHRGLNSTLAQIENID
jgi:hypothetical protein